METAVTESADRGAEQEKQPTAARGEPQSSDAKEDTEQTQSATKRATNQLAL